MSRTDGIELTALSLLRPFWQQLISRLKPAVLLPWLFEKNILAYEEMEDIQTKSSRRERVNVLLDAITRRPLSDAIAFCRKLSRTDGVQDLGRAILASAELPSIDAIGSEEGENPTRCKACRRLGYRVLVPVDRNWQQSGSKRCDCFPVLPRREAHVSVARLDVGLPIFQMSWKFS